MAQRGRPTAQIVLSDDERETLQRWARRPKTGQALALRCRIVLAAAGGALNRDIAVELGCNAVTVGKWRARFAAKRLDGLLDEPRPGQPRKVTDDIVEQVIVATLEESPPDGATQWSTRSMAAKVGLNQTAVSRIWRTFGLKPHRIEDFKLSTDNASELVFLNPGHADHLKRIIYRRQGDGGLEARVEGEDDGRAFAVDYPYRRSADGCSAR